MSWSYRCPKCHVMLNPRQSIILVASREEQRFLIGLHPQPGNYEVYLPPEAKVEAGSRWDFYCPACQGRLISEEDEDLCVLERVTGEALEQILFSRVSGEHVTFVVAQRKIIERFGEQADLYLPRLVHM